MKNKSKLVLALSVLTAATIAAGATGTFAWFTTNRQASVTINNITVKANQSTLVVDIANAHNDGTGTKTEDGVNKIWTANASSAIADVSSGDGLSFSQATFVAGDNSKLSKVTDVTSKTSYYTQYYVTVTNNTTGGSGKAFNLYLGENTKITPTATNTAQKDKNLAGWSRVAITYVGTAAPSTVPTTLGTGMSTKVIFKSSVADAADVETAGKYLPATAVTAGDSYADALQSVTLKTDAFPTILEDTEANRGTTSYLGNVAAASSACFLVSIWMEGTECMDQNTAKDGIENIVLDFRGFDA